MNSKTANIETVTLTPFELAELLGLEREDAPFLSSAHIRLPAAWPDHWRTKLGPLELSTHEVGMILGRGMRTVQDWIRLHGLVAREVNGTDYGVSPAALVAFLRRRSARRTPVIVETPAQEKKRAAEAKARAAAVCSRVPPRSP